MSWPTPGAPDALTWENEPCPLVCFYHLITLFPLFFCCLFFFPTWKKVNYEPDYLPKRLFYRVFGKYHICCVFNNVLLTSGWNRYFNSFRFPQSAFGNTVCLLIARSTKMAAARELLPEVLIFVSLPEYSQKLRECTRRKPKRRYNAILWRYNRNYMRIASVLSREQDRNPCVRIHRAAAPSGEATPPVVTDGFYCLATVRSPPRQPLTPTYVNLLTLNWPLSLRIINQLASLIFQFFQFLYELVLKWSTAKRTWLLSAMHSP